MIPQPVAPNRYIAQNHFADPNEVAQTANQVTQDVVWGCDPVVMSEVTKPVVENPFQISEANGRHLMELYLATPPIARAAFSQFPAPSVILQTMTNQSMSTSQETHKLDFKTSQSGASQEFRASSSSGEPSQEFAGFGALFSGIDFDKLIAESIEAANASILPSETAGNATQAGNMRGVDTTRVVAPIQGSLITCSICGSSAHSQPQCKVKERFQLGRSVEANGDKQSSCSDEDSDDEDEDSEEDSDEEDEYSEEDSDEEDEESEEDSDEEDEDSEDNDGSEAGSNEEGQEEEEEPEPHCGFCTRRGHWESKCTNKPSITKEHADLETKAAEPIKVYKFTFDF
jgi:hypothetical protein